MRILLIVANLVAAIACTVSGATDGSVIMSIAGMLFSMATGVHIMLGIQEYIND